MLEIKDAVAVITGCAGGIGEELAKYWVRHDGRVVLADVSADGLSRVEAEIKTLGGRVALVVCNVTQEEDCARLADTAIEKFGQINLVAPCAGITRDALLVAPDRETGKVAKNMSLDDFQAVININLTGTFLTVRECAERMINQQCRLSDLLVFLHRFLGDRGADQLLLLQGRHVGDAQGYHR